MANRMTRREAWSYYEGVLANAEVAEFGGLACLDTATGNIVAAKTATTLKPLGYFENEVAITGNGTLTVRVRLFRERNLHWFPNDVTNAVTTAMVGGNAYLKAGPSITSLATGASIAGQVMSVSTRYGVLVDFV